MHGAFANMEPIVNNYIDNDIKSIIMPFHIIQSLLLFPKLKIHNNIVTFNRFNRYFISLSVIILQTYVFISGNVFRITVDNKFRHQLYYFIQLISVFVNYSDLLMIFFLNIFNKKFHAELVLNMQKVLQFKKSLKYISDTRTITRSTVYIKLSILLLSYLINNGKFYNFRYTWHKRSCLIYTFILIPSLS